jgi:hypothetical protein
VCRWCATYFWKALNEGYNFVLDISSIKGLQTKLWASKVTRIPILGISGLPNRSPATKWHLGVGPMAKHIIYYKEEGDGFLQVWAMVSLVSWLHMAHPCTNGSFVHQKCSNFVLTNLLFSLCRFMWISDPLVACLNAILEF